ncbi:MAG: hypothetical protein OXE05_00790 [Chloroflexi bacterium]|nr:hypothetical protein [Chloroflexota bacterium]
MTRTEERISRPTDAVSGLESAYAHLATKADMEGLRGELKGDINTLKWAIGVQFALLVIILGRLFDVIPLG